MSRIFLMRLGFDLAAAALLLLCSQFSLGSDRRPPRIVNQILTSVDAI